MDVDFVKDIESVILENLKKVGIVLKGAEWDFGNDIRLMSPIEWIKQETVKNLEFDRQSPIHGDLHVANVFILPDDSPRLIDFGRTGLGHIYRDFAALETSIRLTCINDIDFSLLRESEDQICKIINLGQHIDYRNLKGSTDLREAIRTTMEIRRLALDVECGYNVDKSMYEYLFAVVMHMIRYGMGIADEVKAGDKRKNIRIYHALYGAACATTAANRLMPRT
jgi:hypothetical protein